jgi:hypothetical protein
VHEGNRPHLEPGFPDQPEPRRAREQPADVLVELGLKKRGPTRPFTHADNCKILKADPGVHIQWSEVETAH